MKDEDLLLEIRDRYTYASNEWRDIREEGKKDMRYIAGDPWSPSDRKLREDASRPCMSMDELGQYVNQSVNDLRQNKRGVKVTPQGNGANDKTARYRQGRIRDIEYRSNAQQAYMMMAENAIQRSYGYLRIKSKYVSETSGFDSEPVIEPIQNPDLVTPDPDCLRTDGTGWKYLFYNESRTVSEFGREFKGATKKSFDFTDTAAAPSWFDGSRINLAEYWARESSGTRTLLLLKPYARSAQNPDPQPVEVFADTLLRKPSAEMILKSREIEKFKVTSYLTNGFEILKTTPWAGSSIPFVSCYGKVIFVDKGAGAKKVILSLIRLARDPQMLMAYLVTCQAELVGMTPKTPYMAYEGQFSPAQMTEIQKSLHEPVAVLFAKALTPETGSQLLPLPVRQPYEPAIQALEILKESVRRSVQAAIGVMFLPTQAQRHNEKSGVALEQIKDSAQKGSFHFVDHFEEAIVRTGMILDENIPFFDDTAKDVSIRKDDDTPQMVRINDPQAKDKDGNPQPHIEVNKDHRHDVTISVGSWKESEREAGSDFADTIVGSKVIELVGPQKAPRLIGAAIRMKNLGPLGDAMADIIDPKDGSDPQQAQQMLMQAKQENDHLKQAAQQMSDELKTDKIKMDAQLEMKRMDLDFQRWKTLQDSETKIAVAELGAKVDRLALFLEERARLGQADAAEHDRAHEVGMAAMGAQHAQDAAAQGVDGQAALAEQGQAHALEQGAQGQAHALEQGQQAADLAPQPEA